MNKYVLYHCLSQDVFEKNKATCVIYDKNTGKYYKIAKPFGDLKISYEYMQDIKWQWIDTVFWASLIMIPYMLWKTGAYLLQIEWKSDNMGIEVLLLNLLVLLINMVLHESAHYSIMRIYKCPVRKFGFRIENNNFKFFTDTTSSYMLPKYKRFAVYAAGLMANIYFCIWLLFFFRCNPFVVFFSVTFIITNVIPSKEFCNDAGNIVQMLIS